LDRIFISSLLTVVTLEFTMLFGNTVVVASLVFGSAVYAGKLSTVSSWGDNPSSLPSMLVYTPDKVAEKPAIILGVSQFLRARADD
jgi:hypothetical protein